MSLNVLYTLLTLDLYPANDSERVETCRPKIAFM